MHIAVFATSQSDSSDGFSDWLSSQSDQQGQAPDFCALHASSSCELDKAGEAGSEITSLHGATSCLGVMDGHGMHAADNKGIGAFAIWDPEGDYGSALTPFGNDPASATRQAMEQALASAGRTGEAPDVVWLSSSPGAEEEVLAAVTEIVGPTVPILGGSAADNSISGDWRLFDSDTQYDSGVMVSVLFPSGQISYAFQSGYAPTETVGTVTKAHGRRVFEIDGQPALETYSNWTKGGVSSSVEAPTAILAESTLHPLGRPIGDVGAVPYYLLAHPAEAQPDASIDLFATVEPGETLCLMDGNPDQLVRRAGRVAKLSIDAGRIEAPNIAGALVVYCGGCMLAVKDRMDEVADGVSNALEGAPFLGIFTFGEQGPVQGKGSLHGNLMISCLTFEK